jgi:hypothetical protein
VVVDDEKRTAFPGAATVLEIEFRVTNHDPVPHRLRKSIRGLNRGSFPSLGDQDLVAAEREAQAIRERRHQQGDGLPGRVQPGETVYGVYVTTFPWDPTGTFPDYTLIIKDERHAYTTRPHGADADPLAACRSPGPAPLGATHVACHHLPLATTRLGGLAVRSWRNASWGDPQWGATAVSRSGRQGPRLASSDSGLGGGHLLAR